MITNKILPNIKKKYGELKNKINKGHVIIKGKDGIGKKTLSRQIPKERRILIDTFADEDEIRSGLTSLIYNKVVIFDDGFNYNKENKDMIKSCINARKGRLLFIFTNNDKIPKFINRKTKTIFVKSPSLNEKILFIRSYCKKINLKINQRNIIKIAKNANNFVMIKTYLSSIKVGYNEIILKKQLEKPWNVFDSILKGNKENMNRNFQLFWLERKKPETKDFYFLNELLEKRKKVGSMLNKLFDDYMRVLGEEIYGKDK